MAYNMYVALQDDDKILIMDMDQETGALQPKGEVPVSGGPSALALNPDRNRLYVGHRNSNQLSTFSIDSSDGSLSLLSTIPCRNLPPTCPPTAAAASSCPPTTRVPGSESTPSAMTARLSSRPSSG